MKLVNKVVTQTAMRRATVIVTTPAIAPTGKAVRFASAASRVGVAPIVENRETPFFDTALSPGWYPALREAMSIAGLCPPYECQPMMRLEGLDQIG